MSVEALTTALAAAKAAHKADKADKAKKAAYKAAKKALAAGQAAAAAKAEKKKNKKKRKQAEAEEKPAKKAKVEVDVASLEAAAKAAKATYKADKTNKENKAAWKAAKAALAAAQAGGAAAAAEPAAAAAPAEPEATEEAAPAIALKKAGGGYKAKDSAIPPQDANEQVFVGNLNWAIDDDAIKEFFKDCGSIVNIKWLEDKESGRFKGCGFLTFESVEAATKACGKAGELVMDRELTINFAKNNNGGKKAGGGGRFADKPLSEKPEGCTTVFVGNLSFDIDDDAMYEFAGELKDDIAKIRWLTDRESGDFKGCGFVEFHSTESVDGFVGKNGEKLMGRPIRIDYAKSRDR